MKSISTEKEIYDHKKGRGKKEYGSWWDSEIYTYLQSPMNKNVQKLYQKHMKNKECLILGCSNGKNIKKFQDLPNKIVGIDISDSILEAKQKFPDSIFIKADAEKLPFDKNSFDVVLCEAILHHLDLETALKEIKRVLKKGGILLISYEPGLLNPVAYIGRRFFPSNIHSPQEKPFIPHRFRNILKEQGYKEIYFTYFYLWSNLLPIIGKHFKFKVSKSIIDISFRLENILKFTILKEFFWIFTGVYKVNE